MPSDAADNIHFGIKINGPVNGVLDFNLVLDILLVDTFPALSYTDICNFVRNL